MLTENFIAATYSANKQSAHISSALKDVGIFYYELQPQTIFRSGWKKSSTKPRCTAISRSHVFAAQADKAVISVYSCEKGNQEATVPIPDKIHSLAYADHAAVLIIGTEDGKLMLWEVSTGRISTSSASHLQPVSQLAITTGDDYILSASDDTNIHIWSLSSLISFKSPGDAYNSSNLNIGPSHTFTNHRAAITALAVGHSASTTNFVVSASSDNTCYIWHLETCQILRTLLLPTNTLSIVIDPADRALYFGLDNGDIHNVDLYGRQSIYDNPSSAPIQLTENDSWKSSSTEIGSVLSIALSYDGTALITGHQAGSLIRWDVGKHRVVSEVANLNQPITNLHLLTPDGLAHDKKRLTISEVVKPRLELNVEAEKGTLRIPPTYNIQARITERNSSPFYLPQNDIVAALNHSGFPPVMLENAIQALLAKSAGVSGGIPTGDKSKIDGYKIEQLQEQLAVEKKNISWFQNYHQEQQRKHAKRQKVRKALGIRKREAYSAAEKQGKNGDAAMKIYHEVESMLDSESDEEVVKQRNTIEEVLGQKMDVDDGK